MIAGCNKEKEHCWTCKYTYKGSSKPDKTGDTVICNFTKSDIELREGLTFESNDPEYNLWRIDNCQQQ